MNMKSILFAAIGLCALCLGPPVSAQQDFKNRVRDEGTPGINVLRLAAAMADTETVTVNGVVWEASYDGVVTAGRVEIDLSGYGTKASQTLTASGVFSDAETITLGAVTYTLKDTLGGGGTTANQIKIAASTALTLDNIKSAVNLTGTPGTDYGSATVIHPTITATTNADTTQLFVAKVTGTGGNALASTETCANSAFGAATLASGANPTAENGTDAFVAATNASVDAPINAVKISANEVVCYTRVLNKNWASTETLAGSNNVWAAAAFYGQSVGKVSDPPLTAQFRTATATEVTLQTMHFFFAFAPTGAIIQIRNTDGTVKVSDGAMTISGRRVTWASSGSTDVDADDVVSVVAW